MSPKGWVESRRELLDHGMPLNERHVKRLLSATRWINFVFTAIALALLASSLFLIVNTIRLATFARRREIEVMKLVGASNWFVRLPFMMEGMLCGLGGALLSIVLLGGAYRMLLSKWLDTSTSSSISVQSAHSMPFFSRTATAALPMSGSL